MDGMTVLGLVSGLLGISCLVLGVRLFQYKKQIQHFTEKIRQRRNLEMNRPVDVELFAEDIVELAVALNDYTDDQKELTLQLTRDRERLKYVIAGISHDFRTPLTAAYGYQQLVRRSGELSGKTQEYLEISMEKTLYLKELSDEFFELSAIEANLEKVELEKVHLNKLLQECILGQYEWIAQRGLQANFQVPEEDVYIFSNEMYLKRMIENIFSNMKKYAEGFVELRLEVEKDCVRLITRNDTDCLETEADKVFEPFYRGRARNKEGSGLGLYVVKCLAEAMGYEVHSVLQGQFFEIQIVIGMK